MENLVFDKTGFTTSLDGRLPSVTVIMPVRNEAKFILCSLGAVLNQYYPSGKLEVIVTDGISTDGTREIIQGMKSPGVNLRMIDNPGIIVPTGLNAALREAQGEVIIRVDGHCEIAPDYVLQCVRGMDRHNVDCIGGVVKTVGHSTSGKAISLAMSSAFGVGDSVFRIGSNLTSNVDTVPFPAYSRLTVENIGLYDEEFRCNEDDEYNYRLRKMGGGILLSPQIVSRYHPRSSLRSLWKQYFQYGLWKVRVLQKHPKQMCLRQFVPPVFVAALVFSLLLAPITLLGKISLALVAGSYVLANLFASLKAAWPRSWRLLPYLPLVFTVLHVSYGLGFLTGLMKFIHRWGDLRGKVPEHVVAELGAPFSG